MSAIQFVHPWYLLGLILVPLMVVWYIWHYRKQEPALQHSDIAVFDGIGKSLRVRLRWLPYGCVCWRWPPWWWRWPVRRAV